MSLKYEKPILVSFHLDKTQVGRGVCGTGSGELGPCNPGAGATACPSGTGVGQGGNPGGVCAPAGAVATGKCTPNGGGPGGG